MFPDILVFPGALIWTGMNECHVTEPFNIYYFLQSAKTPFFLHNTIFLQNALPGYNSINKYANNFRLSSLILNFLITFILFPPFTFSFTIYLGLDCHKAGQPLRIARLMLLDAILFR